MVLARGRLHSLTPSNSTSRRVNNHEGGFEWRGKRLKELECGDQQAPRGGRRAIRVSWYHFRAAFHLRWSGYLTVVLLIGLVGGVAMGAVAGARRTQSAFSTYLAVTHTSNLEVQASSNLSTFTAARIEKLGKQLSHLHDVTHVAYRPTFSSSR